MAAFRERYGRAAEREVGGGAARRLGRLVSPFLMRRRKTDPDVAPELPEKVVSDRYVELTREQAALYEAATADTLARKGASTGIARRGQVLRLLQSLRQICNSPAHFLRESADGWDAGAQAARSGVVQLEELMDSVAVAGDAALIFTGYVSMGHLIQAHLCTRGMPAEFLHGGVPAVKRQEIEPRELGCVARLDPGAECGEHAHERAPPAHCRTCGHLGDAQAPKREGAPSGLAGPAGSPASFTGSRRSIVVICIGSSFCSLRLLRTLREV